MDSDKISISIITCTYRINQKYLEECLESVKMQQFTDIEHIFIDSSSESNVKDIVDSYSSSVKYPISYYWARPQGIYQAINYGISVSNGKYILVLHHDDKLVNSNVLTSLVKLINIYKDTDWFLGNLTILIKDKVFRVRNTSLINKAGGWLLKHNVNWVSHAASLIKKDVFLDNGFFNEKYKIAADYDYWLKIYGKVNVKLLDMDICYFRYHKGSTSLSMRNLRKSLKELFEISRANKV